MRFFQRLRQSHASNKAKGPKKLALLIGSPVEQLRGTDNDVQRMSDLLSRHGFRITTCSGKLYGMRATRERIKKRWKELNSQCAPDDTVVIYYSGHGGLIQLTEEEMEKIDAERAQPWRYQFIVPIDYHSGSDFRGVLDVELTRWLRETTRKTHNVTVIFDCCHSARMAKNNEDNGFQVKSINNASYQAASRLLNELRESGDPEDHIFVGGNPYAVRIAAAAADSFAWETVVEHRILGFRAKRNYGGLLTRHLVDVIEEAEKSGQKISWRTVMTQVRQHIPQTRQVPRADGPYTRILFSLETMESVPLPLTIEGDDASGGRRAIIHGGRIMGVCMGNHYDIVVPGLKQSDGGRQPFKAAVTGVNGFRAEVKLDDDVKARIGGRVALAYLTSTTLPKFDAKFTEGLETHGDLLRESMFLKFHDANWQGHPLVVLKKEHNRIVLTDDHDNQIASQALNNDTVQPEILRAALRDAENLAHAQHLLNLVHGVGYELLTQSVEITVGLVGKNKAEGKQLCHVSESEDRVASNSIASDGELCYIKIHNRGKETVYVSVFNVNVAGRVTWISASFAMGIDLPSQRLYTIGHGEFSSLEGIKLSWPSGVVSSEGRGVQENLVFIISNREVDLRQLSEPQEWLEKKDMTPERGRAAVQYAVKHASFVLEP